MEELKATVAKNITALRVASRLTQLELGEKLSYSDKAVSRWERGDAVPDAYVLLKMAGIFGVSVDYLLAEHGESEPRPKKKPGFNHNTVTLISILGVWTAALLAFALFYILDSAKFIIFAYALPVSIVVMLVLNSVWGNRSNNLFIISALLWAVIASLYLTFLSKNMWILFVLGVPSQAIVWLCFKIKNKK